jgi:hypothetical protein
MTICLICSDQLDFNTTRRCLICYSAVCTNCAAPPLYLCNITCREEHERIVMEEQEEEMDAQDIGSNDSNEEETKSMDNMSEYCTSDSDFIDDE